MQIKKITNNKQKLILISLIVSEKFCNKIIPILLNNKDLIYQHFTSYYQIVLSWIIEFFQKYNKSPGNHIQDIYNSKKEVLKEVDQDFISEFLHQLSSKFEKEENYNIDYILDESIKYLREVNLNILQNKIDEAKANHDIDAAEQLVLSYHQLENEMEFKQETFLFSDIETAYNICENNEENNKDKLFKFEGDFGEKVGWICREDFFCFTGVAKIGKSFYIRHLALFCALKYNLNVVIINLEMSHKKYCRNFYQDIADEVKKAKTIKIPYYEYDNNKQSFIIKYTEKEKTGLTGGKIVSRLRRTAIQTSSNIVVKSYPSSSLSFQRIKYELDDLLVNGFITDVVLIDFLDNTQVNTKEFRHAINEKWTLARKLAQEKHLVVGTVSHAQRKNFKKSLNQGDVNEDYRKENTITHMFGINQLPEEKEKQISRLNILFNRDEDFNPTEFFIVLECRDIGRVMIDNKREKDVYVKDGDSYDY